MEKPEIKSKISAFMKKKAGKDITDSTDLSTCIDEADAESTVNALMKELKMSPSATDITIKKGVTVSTLATQVADAMKDEDDSDDKAEKVDEAADDKDKMKEMKKKMAKVVEDVLGEAKKKKKDDDDDDKDEK